VVVVASVVFMMALSLLAVDPRMTIHHSGRGHKQENSERIGGREMDGMP